jgi:hypothetical protein
MKIGNIILNGFEKIKNGTKNIKKLT